MVIGERNREFQGPGERACRERREGLALRVPTVGIRLTAPGSPPYKPPPPQACFREFAFCCLPAACLKQESEKGLNLPESEQAPHSLQAGGGV